MDKQEFKELWENCILPSFKKLKEQDDSIILRDGSQEVLCTGFCPNKLQESLRDSCNQNENCINYFPTIPKQSHQLLNFIQNLAEDIQRLLDGAGCLQIHAGNLQQLYGRLRASAG